METPDFFEEKDLLGQPKPKIPVTGNEPYDDLEEFVDENALVDASKTSRFFNYILDAVGIIAFTIICVVLLRLVGIRHLVDWEDKNFAIVFFTFVYYLFFEGGWGTTPGKLVTGTRVVKESGERIDFGNALGRSVCRLIPFEAVSFLFMSKGGWHDSITKTRVVEDK